MNKTGNKDRMKQKD